MTFLSRMVLRKGWINRKEVAKTSFSVILSNVNLTILTLISSPTDRRQQAVSLIWQPPVLVEFANFSGKLPLPASASSLRKWDCQLLVNPLVKLMVMPTSWWTGMERIRKGLGGKRLFGKDGIRFLVLFILFSLKSFGLLRYICYICTQNAYK